MDEHTVDFVLQIGKYIILCFLCAMVVIVGKNILASRWQESDIRAFYSAAIILRNNPRRLYDFSLQRDYQQKILKNQSSALAFINPPIALLPYIPFSFLPPAQAYWWYCFFLLGLSVAIFYFLRRFFDGNTPASVYQYLIPLTFLPLSFLIVESQNAIWFLVILTGMLYLTRKHQPFYAGCIGALFWYKPQLAPLASLFILFGGPRRMRIGFLCGMVLFIGINYGMAGGEWKLFAEKTCWFVTVFESSFESLRFMVSWQGFVSQLSQLVPHLPVYGMSLVMSFVTYVVSIVASLKPKTFSQKLSYGLPIIVTGTLLGGMHIHYQDAIVLAFLFYRYYQKPVSLWFMLLTACGWIIFLFTYYSPLYPNPLPFLPTLYIVLVWVLCIKNSMSVKATATALR